MAHAVAALVDRSLRGWTPVRISQHADRVDWALLDGPPRAPFFEQDADAAMRHPFNAAFARTTTLDALDVLDASDASAGEAPADDAQAEAAASGLAPSPAPCGLIFHWSRSGSTLAAQMIAQLDDMTVLSEASPIDALLRRAQADDVTTSARVRAFADHVARSAGTSRYVIKFAPWHMLRLPLLQRAFPGVPIAFLFRAPHDILDSHERTIGADALAGGLDPALLGLDAEGARALSPQAYTAHLLEVIAQAALDAHDAFDANDGLAADAAREPDSASRQTHSPRPLVIGYDEMPHAVIDRLLPFLGIAPSMDDLTRMRAMQGRDAKHPDRAFAAPAAAARDGRAHGADAGIERLDALYAALAGRRSLAL